MWGHHYTCKRSTKDVPGAITTLEMGDAVRLGREVCCLDFRRLLSPNC
jgi:hypothetical protein